MQEFGVFKTMIRNQIILRDCAIGSRRWYGVVMRQHLDNTRIYQTRERTIRCVAKWRLEQRER